MQRHELIKTQSGISEKLGRIHSSSATMSSLIFDMFNIERMEAGSLELEKTAVDVSNLVKSAINNIRSVAEHRDIILSANLPDRDIKVIADEKIIERVLQNLLGNAIKFAPQGGKVRLQVDIENQLLSCSVSDNGLGIPKDQFDRIFERFGQVRNENAAQDFGIGLAFSKLAVEQHGGTISVENNLDGGSKFTFTLPQ